MIKLCTACSTSYEDDNGSLTRCKICEDERQFVPASGQKWLPLSDLRATHQNKWQQHLSGLFSLQTVPAFAINQRAFLLQTPDGNILWDCIANLDDATLTLIHALGGIRAIAISHPHYYSTLQDWAAAFDAPVYLHTDDREWIMRQSPHIQLWQGDEIDLLPEVRLLRLGGHFPGGSVLHWTQNGGVLLSGDIVQVAPGANTVSFMWSYPNMLPLSARAVNTLIHRLDKVRYTQIYGAFAGREIMAGAQQIVKNAAEHYIRCLRG